MDAVVTTCEIYETADEKGFGDGIGGGVESAGKHSIQEDIDRLFESLLARNSGCFVETKDSFRRNPSKRPVRGGVSTASRIGITEPLSLKQALRGMCILQASEVAATKRFSKPGNILTSSDATAISQLYSAVVVEANQNVLPPDNGKGTAVETICRHRSSQDDPLALPSDEVAWPKEIPACDSGTPIRIESLGENVDSDAVELKGEHPSFTEEAPRDLTQKGKLCDSSVVSDMASVDRASRAVFNASYFLGPIRGKSFVKKRFRRESTASSGSSPCPQNPGFDSDGHTDSSKIRSNLKSEIDPTDDIRAYGSVRTRFFARKADEKVEFSQSSKSSAGDFSCSTSGSDMNNLSRSCRSCTRPHMSKDSRWEAIRSVQMPNGGINLKHLKLLKSLGSGDIGTVYLAQLTGTNCLFALKVMDLEFLGARRKLARAETEKGIMRMLDHPFLPTLYAHISTEKLSCLVMEYCPGGDLHVLRQKQPTRSFSEQAARFYVAEVLLALEYLHMLGVIYRDLKPENVLVREDGHIMLSDFDLSLRCSVNPTVVVASSPESEQTTKMSTPCNDSICVEPFCLNPSFPVPCFTPRLLSIPTRSRKSKSDLASQIIPLPQLVVEPTGARSNSFVGTHEYLAPEIIKGEGHGSAVDWWTFGIFIYELLFGKTPFKGPSNDETLANVVSRRLKFPETPAVSHPAKDLIRGLLVKNPDNRLGSGKGAADIKRHSFFKGLNWALIRCAVPPELPKAPLDVPTAGSSRKDISKDILEAEMQMGFEVF
ncbi:hypothetical protein MLD38_025282 [Melastoma candidum]|uniref:Uncharacterized protein n=1 Tax=Melastoma candidum TaxID=119954 RepID=A0ACB9NUW7_9MYRT|nr:hypothetical protein MLD38_025282 [Melastoma candidum]